MSSRINILFIIHTEYQMMVALSTIADIYSDKKMYQITICQIDDGTNRRFNFNVNLEAIPHIEYRVLRYNEGERDFNNDLHNALLDLTLRQFHILVIFNHHLFVDIYLAKVKSKQGCEVYLAPDGLKPYAITKKFSPRWTALRTIGFFRFVHINKLKFIAHVPTLPYANLDCIEEVWIQYPMHFNNKFNKRIRKIDIMKSAESIKIVNSFFLFDSQTHLPRLDKVIFYANQPLQSEPRDEVELRTLQSIHSKFPDYQVVVKFHPLTANEHKSNIRDLPFVYVLETSMMAELFIANLSESIVLGFWSAALLIDNKKCRFYWLHLILKNEGLMPHYVKFTNPTQHIVEVESIQDIK